MKQQEFLMPAYNILEESDLVFHPERKTDKSKHPLKGLVDFGPYSRSLINQVVDPIRVATIFPFGQQKTVTNILSELQNRHLPKERRNYLIEFPGFSRVFGLRIVQAASSCNIELPKSLSSEILDIEKPHILLVEKINQAISVLQAQRTEFDILTIYLPEEWNKCFVVPNEDFDLHDYIKAITATLGIPSQVLRESKILAYSCRASVMWRLGIALYAKAGGVPWKIADTPPDTAYIGLSYALKRDVDQKTSHFITCCSQVFDSDGAGLEFLTYDTDGYYVERENPYLNHSEMRRLMARSLNLYQKRHAGRVPRKVVIHKSTEFKESEIDGCFDAWKSSDGLELIQVQDDVSWFGLLINPPVKGEVKGKPNGYPCVRGSSLQISGKETLLWTQGNAPSAVGGKDFFKEGKGIPMPLLLRRFSGHGTWDESCKSILGLTKMNWNNDSLYDRLPVTMAFAKILAQTIKRMPKLKSGPYEFRYFI